LLFKEAIGDWNVGFSATRLIGIRYDGVLLTTLSANGKECLAMVCWCRRNITPFALDNAMLPTGHWTN